MRHHLRVIMSYAQQEKYQEMMDYLGKYSAAMTKEEAVICYCRNMAVDAGDSFLCGRVKTARDFV